MGPRRTEIFINDEDSQTNGENVHDECKQQVMGDKRDS